MAVPNIRLSESALNVVENIACKIAQRNAGTITPNHIMPYLPVSLNLIKTCLDQMVDGSSVMSDQQDGLVVYRFAAYRESLEQDGILEFDTCISCDKDPTGPVDGSLCPSCANLLRNELEGLAEKMAWPAEAVYEHEILFHAAEHDGSKVHVESLAAVSRYTLRNMRQKLERITLDHFAQQEVDRTAGLVCYRFPAIKYPRKLYDQNMSIIRTYPASVMEEVQLKVVRILLSIGLMFVAMLGLAFWGVPFQILLALLAILCPIVTWRIWCHRDKSEM